MVFAENSDNKLIFPNRRILALDLIILCVIISFHTVLLGAYFIPIYTGVDPNGYHVAGKIFAKKGEFSFVPHDYASFVGRMWVITDEGRAYAKYPPFYPLLCGAAIRVFGDNADFYINRLR